MPCLIVVFKEGGAPRKQPTLLSSSGKRPTLIAQQLFLLLPADATSHADVRSMQNKKTYAEQEDFRSPALLAESVARCTCFCSSREDSILICSLVAGSTVCMSHTWGGLCASHELVQP